MSSSNGDAIRIVVSGVTIDLGGNSLSAYSASNAGIYVAGHHPERYLKPGAVSLGQTATSLTRRGFRPGILGLRALLLRSLRSFATIPFPLRGLTRWARHLVAAAELGIKIGVAKA